MRNWIGGFALLFVLLIIFFVTRYSRPIPRQVELDVIEGEVIVSQGDQKQTVKANESIAAISGNLEEKRTPLPETPAPAELAPTIRIASQPINPTPELYSFNIDLVDALGDPIPNGILKIASQTFRSTSSKGQIRNLEKGNFTLIASAEGYREVTAGIQVPDAIPSQIQLEYLCNFEIAVQKGFEGKFPYAGAEVSLYEGMPVQRPVQNSMHLQDASNDPEHAILHLERRERKIQVTDMSKVSWSVESVRTDREQWDDVQRGTELYGFQKEYPRGGLQPIDNSMLRLWDSIALIHPGKTWCDDQGVGTWSVNDFGYLLFKRNNNYPFFLLRGSSGFETTKEIAKSITNHLGKCRFENLPPRIYYVKAHKNDWQSEPRMLLPIDHSVTICLPDAGDEGTVRVSVRRKDEEKITYYEMWDSRISGADVQLKAIGKHIILSATMQWVDYFIHRVPVGNYQLTITPPNYLNANPPSQTMEIRVQQPLTWVDVSFDLNYGLTLSGTVLEQKKQIPVTNYPLILQDKNVSGYSLKNFAEYARIKTDAKGNFSFPSLQPGDYRITSDPNQAKETGYIHPSAYNVSAVKTIEEPVISLKNENVKDITYPVVPSSIVHLSGIVIKENGEPVGNAILTLKQYGNPSLIAGNADQIEDEWPGGNFIYSQSPKDLKIVLVQVAKADGSFDIEMALPGEIKPAPIVLIAENSPPPIHPLILRDNGQIESLASRTLEQGPLDRGQVVLTLREKEDIPNIKIVLEPAEKGGCNVVGTIRTPEGQIPPYVEAYTIYVTQDHPDHPMDRSGRYRLTSDTQPNSEGTYQVHWLKPGPFTLRLDPANPKQEKNKVPPIPRIFSMRQFNLQMPVNRTTLQHDIVLELENYIQGRIIDENGNPLPGVQVYARFPDEPIGWIHGADDTNENGDFLMTVNPENEYDLYVAKPDQYDYWYEPILKGLKAPIDNLIFQIKSDSAKQVQQDKSQ